MAVGLMIVVAVAGIAAKTAFPSELPAVVGVAVYVLSVPPALAVCAAVGELSP